MVEDRVTDGKRIAQLLASELTGRETVPLADVEVVDADPDAEPTPGGTVAYGVSFRGDRVGRVTIYPEGAALSLAVDPVRVVEQAENAPGLTAVGADEEATVRIEYGAAVKRAVDALVAGLSR